MGSTPNQGLGRFLLTAFSRLLSALGLLVLLVTATPLVSWYGRLLAGREYNSHGEILIVLGGSQLEKDIIGEDSYWRAVYALRAYQEGGIREIVLSGAGASESMADFLTFQGVPQNLIKLETHSRTTRENALEVYRLLAEDPRTKVLLTSDYHMFRALRAFRRAGLTVRPWPIPDAEKRASRWSYRWWVFLDESVETVKILYYFFRGWL